MRTLVKEIIGTVAMSQVIKSPGLPASSGTITNGILVDQHRINPSIEGVGEFRGGCALVRDHRILTGGGDPDHDLWSAPLSALGGAGRKKR